MPRIRGEPVEVWLRHGRPARFVWRGRLYVVLFVLDKRTGKPPPGTIPPEPGSDEPRSPEYWLVGEFLTTMFDEWLRRDVGTDRWTLSRN